MLNIINIHCMYKYTYILCSTASVFILWSHSLLFLRKNINRKHQNHSFEVSKTINELSTPTRSLNYVVPRKIKVLNYKIQVWYMMIYWNRKCDIFIKMLWNFLMYMNKMPKSKQFFEKKCWYSLNVDKWRSSFSTIQKKYQ